MKSNISGPGPVLFVDRGAPFSGNRKVTLPAEHAGAAVGDGAATTGVAGGFVAATTVGLGVTVLVGVRVGVNLDVVTVGSGVTVAGSGVEVMGT